MKILYFLIFNFKKKSNSPFARCIHFKDAPIKNKIQKSSILIYNNTFKDFILDDSQNSISAISFSSSTAYLHYDSIKITKNRFDGLCKHNLYSIMDEDFNNVIEAPMNWWGAENGPKDACNDGDGSNIYWDHQSSRTNVNYRPWCQDPSCNISKNLSKNCPWSSYTYAIIILSIILFLTFIILTFLGIRQHCITSHYKKVMGEAHEQYHSKLLSKVTNLSELCERYNILQIPWYQIKLKTIIGEGTFGVVYLADYSPSEEYLGFSELKVSTATQQIALKILKKIWIETQYNTINSFLDEIKIMSMVDHANVQNLIGFSIDPNENICMISEYLPMGNLSNLLLSKVEIDISKKMDISLDTAYGMSYLHSKGISIVHRDLKPANILISEKWVARVADFGTSLTTNRFSLVASSVGTTPFYSSPEAILNNEFSEKSDVFAYGITLYELWAGQLYNPCLSEDSLTFFEDAAKNQIPLDLPKLNSIPQTISNLISICTEYDIENRPNFTQIISLLLSSRLELRNLVQK